MKNCELCFVSKTGFTSFCAASLDNLLELVKWYDAVQIESCETGEVVWTAKSGLILNVFE